MISTLLFIVGLRYCLRLWLLRIRRVNVNKRVIPLSKRPGDIAILAFFFVNSLIATLFAMIFVCEGASLTDCVCQTRTLTEFSLC
jgi:hypothetical protein